MQFIISRRNVLFLYLAQSFFLISAPPAPRELNQLSDEICWGAQDYQLKIAQLFATAVPVSAVTFTDDIGFEAREFSYLTGLKSGQLVSAKDIKNAFFYLDLRALFSKIILKCSQSNQGVGLHFTLTGYQRLGGLTIAGVLFGKERYRQLYEMQMGERFELVKHELALTKILNLLKNEGYFNAKVSSQTKLDLKTKLVNVVLKIKPGKRFKIVHLDVNAERGVSSVSGLGPELLTQQVTITKLLKKKLFYKKYSAKLLMTELTKLKKYLAKTGYPFAQIKFNLVKNPTTHQVRINFTISLKQKQHCKFRGNHFLSEDDLFDYIMLAGGSVLRLPLALIVCDLIDFYQKKGFEHVTINGKPTLDGYEFSISEGKRRIFRKPKKKPELIANMASPKVIKNSPVVFLGKTVLHGNAKMRFDYLTKFLPYRPGDLFNNQKLTTTLWSIKNLDCFDAIKIYPANVVDEDRCKPIILDLKADHQLELRTRLGFQKVSKNFAFQAGGTYKVGMSVLYKNITNRGDQLIFDADLTRFYRYIVAKYQRPIFLHVPLSWATNLYINKYDQPIFIGSKNCLYHVYQQGALVDIGYQGQVLNLNLNVGLEGDMVSDISKEYARAIDFSDALLATQVPFLFIEPTVMMDRLDDKIDPSYGLFMLATVKGMVAIGSKQSYFLKFLLEQSSFLPVFKSAVFAMRLSFGHIFSDQFNVIMPIERFYLGGAYSIRSYEPDFAPPLGVISTPECREILVPQGGKTMMNACFELRVPIYQNLSGVLFQDLGTLLKSGASLGQGELLSATGFGVRYKTPVGPIRFDIGWRPKHDSKSPNFAWFLTIGNAF